MIYNYIVLGIDILDDEFICADHFSDQHLRNFILSGASAQRCKYCETPKACSSLTRLARHIEEGIRSEYEDPYLRGVAYDSDAEFYEDRFPGVHVHSTMQVLESEIEVDEFEILEDISAFFENDYWSELDNMFSLSKHDIMYQGWEAFRYILKHEVRYLFFSESWKEANSVNYGDDINPYLILDEVAGAIERLNLFRKYPLGRFRVFRGRQHDKEINKNARDLGSPPRENARANRMSPSGIPMFYGAFDVTTCELEVVDLSWGNSRITIGEFINLSPLNLIDFGKSSFIPSLFDVDERKHRAVGRFIESFVSDLSIPVSLDDKDHLEYVPTQVVTESLRTFFSRNRKFDGIIYNSVKNPPGKCVVLFCPNGSITDITDSSMENLLSINSNLTEPFVLGLNTRNYFYDIQITPDDSNSE